MPPTNAFSIMLFRRTRLRRCPRLMLFMQENNRENFRMKKAPAISWPELWRGLLLLRSSSLINWLFYLVWSFLSVTSDIYLSASCFLIAFSHVSYPFRLQRVLVNSNKIEIRIQWRCLMPTHLRFSGKTPQCSLFPSNRAFRFQEVGSYRS